MPTCTLSPPAQSGVCYSCETDLPVHDMYSIHTTSKFDTFQIQAESRVGKLAAKSLQTRLDWHAVLEHDYLILPACHQPET